jgi:hypothetical protein
MVRFEIKFRVRTKEPQVKVKPLARVKVRVTNKVRDT